MSTCQVPFWVNILSIIVGLGIAILMGVWPGIAERRRARRQRESKLSYTTRAAKERVLNLIKET